jgi:hypothetical protein
VIAFGHEVVLFRDFVNDFLFVPWYHDLLGY